VLRHRFKKAKSKTIAELVIVGASVANTEAEPGIPAPVMSFMSSHSDPECYTGNEEIQTRL